MTSLLVGQSRKRPLGLTEWCRRADMQDSR
jgi:hypothetical protein